MTKLLVAFRNFANAPIYETSLTQRIFTLRILQNDIPSLKDIRHVEFMDDVCCHDLLLQTDNITNTDSAAHTKY